MKTSRLLKDSFINKQYQSGIVLFIALIALVVMSLAAVALIRSVDTNTLISGNLAFKQAATTSADAGLESAIAVLAAMRDDAANDGKSAVKDDDHTLNITDLDANPGYFSYLKTGLKTTAELANDAIWDGKNNRTVAQDASGNTVKYIIQRMCRLDNKSMQNGNDCLLSSALEDGSNQQVPLPQTICKGSGCPAAGQSPQIRVTIRVEGPRNTLSYVQAYVH